MRPLGDVRRHFWLVQRMAKLHELDLSQAQARGDIDQETWSKMVERCRGCAWPEGCERFLRRGEALEGLPGNCRNRERFAGLLVDQIMGENP